MPFKMISQIQLILLIIIAPPLLLYAQRGHISELRYKADSAIKRINDLSRTEKREYAENFPAKKDSARNYYLKLDKLVKGYLEYEKYVRPDGNISLTRAHKIAGDDYFVALAETKKLQQLGLLANKFYAADSLQIKKRIKTINKVDSLIHGHEKRGSRSSAAEFKRTYKRHELELELVKWLLGKSKLN